MAHLTQSHAISIPEDVIKELFGAGFGQRHSPVLAQDVDNNMIGFYLCFTCEYN